MDINILKVRNQETKEWEKIPAIKGDKGETPVKGTDYWTAADKEEIVTETLNSIPLATTEIAGKVKPDGTTITIDEDGTIHSAGGSSSASDVSFDNTDTGLEATDVQSALVEINTDLVGSEEVQEMINENLADIDKGKFSGFNMLYNKTSFVITNPVSQEDLLDAIAHKRSVRFGAQRWMNTNELGARGINSYVILDGTNDLSDAIAIPSISTSPATITFPYDGLGTVIGSMLICAQQFSYFPKALSKIYYDHSTSGLTATNIPAAIDELATKINSLVDGNEVSY